MWKHTHGHMELFQYIQWMHGEKELHMHFSFLTHCSERQNSPHKYNYIHRRMLHKIRNLIFLLRKSFMNVQLYVHSPCYDLQMNAGRLAIPLLSHSLHPHKFTAPWLLLQQSFEVATLMWAWGGGCSREYLLYLSTIIASILTSRGGEAAWISALQDSWLEK